MVVGGVRASALADEYGTPLVVYCRDSVLARARAYARVDPEALVVYGTKAFPNVALLRLLAAEGLGADVSTGGELEFALRAGVPGERIVFHGNNKSDDELRAAAAAGALVVLDALDEPARAQAAGVATVLIRVTPGIEAETHRAIQTAHPESKFGLVADDAVAAVRDARSPRGSTSPACMSTSARSSRGAPKACSRSSGWPTSRSTAGQSSTGHRACSTSAAASRSGTRWPRSCREPEEFARELLVRLRDHWPEPVRVIFEPGRSLVGSAGFTLYRVGVIKRTAGVAYAAVDGGMSDNPRPQLYGSRYEALLANRADEPNSGTYRIAGKHCESGDVLIDSVELPEPRRDDLLAVPATGAYTLAMASNYNSVPRPAAVLVADGRAELIRRRESLDDLLAFES